MRDLPIFPYLPSNSAPIYTIVITYNGWLTNLISSNFLDPNYTGGSQKHPQLPLRIRMYEKKKRRAGEREREREYGARLEGEGGKGE